MGAALLSLIPAAIYFLMTLRTNLNIGLRHVLPVYPLLYVAIAWALAEAWRRRVRFIRPATIALTMLLAAETLFAWPNYIAFFNLAAGGSRGGIRLLGDSSLDWGQDLPLLAGVAEGESRIARFTCGISAARTRAISCRTSRSNPAQPQMPAPPAVVAVSATFLQGLYVPDSARPFFECAAAPKAAGGAGRDDLPLRAAVCRRRVRHPRDRAASTTATMPSGTSTSP